LNKVRVIIILIIIIFLGPAEMHLEFYSFLDSFSAFGNQVPRAIENIIIIMAFRRPTLWFGHVIGVRTQE